MKGQELENAVSDADYTKAIQIAFELRRPHKLFALFAELCRLGTLPPPPTNLLLSSLHLACFFPMVCGFLRWVLCRKRDVGDRIDKALEALGEGEIRLLFEYVREWNTKPKLCHVAQFVLSRVFIVLPPTAIIEVVIPF